VHEGKCTLVHYYYYYYYTGNKNSIRLLHCVGVLCSHTGGYEEFFLLDITPCNLLKVNRPLGTEHFEVNVGFKY
jgi:hypothetical protein